MSSLCIQVRNYKKFECRGQQPNEFLLTGITCLEMNCAGSTRITVSWKSPHVCVVDCRCFGKIITIS